MTANLLNELNPEILVLDKDRNKACEKDWSEVPAITPDVVL